MLDLPQLGGPTNTTFMCGRFSPMLEFIFSEFIRCWLGAALQILVVIHSGNWFITQIVIGYSCCSATGSVRDIFHFLWLIRNTCSYRTASSNCAYKMSGDTNFVFWIYICFLWRTTFSYRESIFSIFREPVKNFSAEFLSTVDKKGLEGLRTSNA